MIKKSIAGCVLALSLLSGIPANADTGQSFFLGNAGVPATAYDSFHSFTVADSNGVAITIVAAAGTGKRIFVTSINYVVGTGASGSCNFTVKDSAGNILWQPNVSTTLFNNFGSIPIVTAPNASLQIVPITGTTCNASTGLFSNLIGYTE